MDESPAENQPSSADVPTGDNSASPATEPVSLLAWLRSRWKSALLLGLVAAAIAALIIQRQPWGDGNLAKEAKKAADEKDATKGPKDPFTFGAFTLRPSETDRIEAAIKPGHWTAAALEVRANFDDFRGELTAEMVAAGGEGVDLDGLPFRLRVSRPAVLPKLQKKVLDVALFNPVENFSRQVAPRLLSRSGRDVWNARELLTPMPAEQFFFVVLADKPDDYRYLLTIDSVWAPQGSIEDRGLQAHYRVLLPNLSVAVPLPSQPLFWTNTAVLLWDGLDPDRLSPAQQQALIDWLHWGGQLIVSGPDSLDLLRDSFLDGVLPAGPGEAWELSEDALAPLARATSSPETTVRIAQPWTGQHLIVGERGGQTLVETETHEPLIAERRVGRGRTVVTAFRLSQRDLVNWAGYDPLLNAALLRRPSRRFERSPEDRVRVAWADGVAKAAERSSRLNYFSRDGGREPPKPVQTDLVSRVRGQAFNAFGTSFDAEGNLLVPIASGVAGWDDASPVSLAARGALKEAAGIQVPRKSLILSMLAAYVFVLVPLNWLVCRLLGRVEMAWALALAIALIFGLLVVRVAQLDIGFARSTTEIAVLEVQGDYPRAHLTRYCAMYTSLSTGYTLDMDNPGALVLPFATGADVQAHQNRSTIMLNLQPDTGSSVAPVRLDDLDVSSNSTGMVHSEEVRDLGGSITCVPVKDRDAAYQVRNGTALKLENVLLVRATSGAEGKKLLHVAHCEQLEPGAEVELTLSESGEPGDSHPQLQAAAASTSQKLDVSALCNLARNETSVGETRLVAQTGDDLGGLSITPAANQARHATVVVAHVDYGPPAPLAIDFNSHAKISETIPKDNDPVDFLTPEPEESP